MIVRETSCELGSDHHGFVIDGVKPVVAGGPALPENTVAFWWPDRDPELTGFLVSTGSQWGPFAVAIAVHDRNPGPLSADWEDVVELTVEVSEELGVSEMVDGPVAGIDSVAGMHRMRVAARGRYESATRDASLDEDLVADEPLEHYTIDLWPAEVVVASEVVREDSQYARDQMDPPVLLAPPEEGPGKEAAWTIIRDVRRQPGARSIPGGTGTVEVVLELPGTPVRVFNRVQHVFGWPPCRGLFGSADDFAPKWFNATEPDPEGYPELAGHIRCTLLERTRPRRVVMTWNWILEGPGTLDELQPLLPEDGLVTIAIEKLGGRGEDARALVRLVHEGAPGAWLAELESLWRWHLVVQAAR